MLKRPPLVKKMSETLLYPSPHMGAADLEAYMWQKVPGAPDRKFNPFKPTGPVPAQRYDSHNLLGVGQKGMSSTMAQAPRAPGPANSFQTSVHGPRSGASSSSMTSQTPPVHPPGSSARGSYVSSTPHNPIPKSNKPKKHTSKHAPAIPIDQTKAKDPYPDIPMPSSSGKENPFLQAYEELAKEDKYQDFEGPAMWDGPICWNPRAKEMHNMQDWHTERQVYLSKLNCPRRRYLARYAHIRESLCSNRFRNPEYSRVQISTCTPQTNPYNYSSGAPSSMFGSAPLGDQSMSSGVAVQRSIGNLPVHQWISNGSVVSNDVYQSSAQGYTVAPATYPTQSYATCGPNTSWDPTSGTCVSISGAGSTPTPF